MEVKKMPVSIPRSEFCLFGLTVLPAIILSFVQVSIPRSEFCLFGQEIPSALTDVVWGFNSPLGILFVRTLIISMVSSFNAIVSIPRSEFCLFGLPQPRRSTVQT